MQTVNLYGHLKTEFGASYRFDIATAGEALRALNCAFPDRFIMEMRKGSYRVVCGDLKSGMDVEIAHVNSLRLGKSELHIIPIATGSKSARSAGTAKTVAGVALVGAAIFFSGGTLAAPLLGTTAGLLGGVTYGTVAAIGLGLALSGASMLISKATEQPTDIGGSYAFSGPINVNQAGSAVPLIFGEVICGSQAISAGFDVVDIGSNQSSLAWGGGGGK